jgi:hypothetical protein
MIGKVVRTIGIRDKDGVKIGTLYAGDEVTGTVSGAKIIFTTVKRVSGALQTWPAGTNALMSDDATVFIVDAAVPPPPPPPPPPPAPVPAEAEIVMASGSKVTIKDKNGNVLFTYVVP